MVFVVRLGRSRFSVTTYGKVHARREKWCLEPDLQVSLTISIYFLNEVHNVWSYSALVVAEHEASGRYWYDFFVNVI